MKGKKILTLATVALGIGIVGATFAGWAVSDEADPFGIKVSPGSIQTDGTQFVTLKYGTRAFANVEGIKAGEKRLAATVNLIADTKDDTAYTGAFTMELIDQTTSKPEGNAKLIDKLNVDIYDQLLTGNAGSTVTIPQVEKDSEMVDIDSVAHIPPTPGTYKASHTFQVTDNTPHPISIVVSLRDCTAKDLEDIASDVVYLQMDWGKGSALDVEATPIYLSHASEEDHVYCYAWSGELKNGVFPGVEMEKVSDGLYSYLLGAGFDHVIFSEGASAEETTKVAGGDAGLTITDDVRSQVTPCYLVSESKWDAKPDATLAPGYYIKGTINNWTASADWLMTEKSETQWQKTGVQLPAGAKIKAWGKTGNVWKGNNPEQSPCAGTTTDSEGNVVITEAGVYTVNLWLDAANGNFIEVVKA